MAKALASPAALADWLVLLDGIEKSVVAALEDMQQREPSESTENPQNIAAARDAEFRSRLDETIRVLELRLHTARDLAAHVEAMLDSDEQMVRAWRQTAEAARQRLAATAGL